MLREISKNKSGRKLYNHASNRHEVRVHWRERRKVWVKSGIYIGQYHLIPSNF